MAYSDPAPGQTRGCGWRVVLLLVLGMLCAGVPAIAGATTPLEATAAVTPAADDGNLEDRLAACASCHGKHGEGVAGSQYYPHLAGKPAGYLFAQLQAYRDGGRSNAQMDWLLRFVDDSYMHEIADFYAAQPPRTRPADTAAARLTSAMRETADRLVVHGDASRDLPACASCHGSRLTGLQPGVPALVGLPADYLIAQLNLWRTGARKARAPDCMAEIARALSATEIRALAEWLAQQAHVDGEGPAAEGSFVPPRRCGSLAHVEALP
ncbi:MAG: c-type cytochrome [Dokdonella sp.]